jgi:D-psicose/D-tagatose/L-ribulose 3-epimerase
VDWTGVFAALRAIGYDGWLVIESFNGNIKELAAATAIWRDLAPSPDDIAFSGTAFLKKMATG